MTTINIGKEITLDVDFAAMPANAIAHILTIGARNVLMDSHASVTEKEYPDATARQNAARAVAEKKLAALMAGEVRVARTGGTRTSDPVLAEAKRMARAEVVAAAKAKGHKEADIANIGELANARLAKHNERLMAAAKATVAAIVVDDDEMDFTPKAKADPAAEANAETDATEAEIEANAIEAEVAAREAERNAE